MLSYIVSRTTRQLGGMVNGILAAQLIILLGAIGGVCNGLRNYGGFVMPKIVKTELTTAPFSENVPVQLLMLGVLGNAALGGLSGFIVFLFFRRDIWIFQDTAPPTGLHGLIALLSGLAGAVFLDAVVDLFQKRFLGKLGATPPAPKDPGMPLATDQHLFSTVEQLRIAPRASVALAKLM